MAFVTGCGGDAKKANTELPKKVVIGLDDSFPPMGFKDEKGEIVGFDIDMAKEAAKRAGMDVEFKAIDWSSKEAELKSKKIDALWNGLTVSPEREKNILFSNTYMKDKQYVIVRNDDDSIKGKADLAGKVVGVQQASTGEAALQNDPSGKTVKETKSLDYLLQIIPTIADGLKVTVSLFCIVWILSIPGGILMAMLRLSKLPLVDKLVDAFVYLMRGTPLMLQILFVYYALPIITDGAIQMDDATAAVLTFVLNYAAYLCEIFRGGIQSISRGQYEGAKVLGFTYAQTMRKIILPQMFKRVLPPLANETINLLKDTSLVYVLAMNDILRITKSIVQRDFDISAFLVAALFYLIFTFILTNIFNYLERRFAVYED
ncbi:MAG: ABC transporter substrate-binding protein/permease [Veillonella sp.]|nr:ABC transporter substrate-binding protein/permease [Veillonella sp.]